MLVKPIITKIVAVSLLTGFLSPSINIHYDKKKIEGITISLIHTASAGSVATLGGGGAHAVHMPSGGGIHMPMGIRHAVSIPKISKPISVKKPIIPVTVAPKSAIKPMKPITKPITKPVQKGVKAVATQQKQTQKHHTAAIHPHNPHYVYHPHHSHHHGHHYHYPYHGWDHYWDWFWASNIIIGAIVSIIPDNECRDVRIEEQYYKECNGVLFEPVPMQNGIVQYEVVDMQPQL